MAGGGICSGVRLLGLPNRCLVSSIPSRSTFNLQLSPDPAWTGEVWLESRKGSTGADKANTLCRVSGEKGRLWTVSSDEVQGVRPTAPTVVHGVPLGKRSVEVSSEKRRGQRRLVNDLCHRTWMAARAPTSPEPVWSPPVSGRRSCGLPLETALTRQLTVR